MADVYPVFSTEGINSQVTFNFGATAYAGVKPLGYVNFNQSMSEAEVFGGLAASGWHTAAITMRLLVDGELKPAGGIVGVGFDQLSWPHPVYPGDELHLESEILEVRPSKSRPNQGLVKVKTTTMNQDGEAVQVSVGSLIVPRRGE